MRSTLFGARIVDLLATGPNNFRIIDGIICLLVGAVGIWLAWIEKLLAPGGGIFPGGFSPSPAPPPWFQIVLIAIFVVIIMGGAYFYAHIHSDHSLLVATSLASALAWGLSVVGALFWSRLAVTSSVYWNSWFNLFAAAFAAMAVGYTKSTTEERKAKYLLNWHPPC